jgi:tetratricopeptide (TPR) repeat protein
MIPISTIIVGKVRILTLYQYVIVADYAFAVYFIMNEWTKAMADYNTSTDLDAKFVFSHIQLAVAQYKAGNIANSMATFRRTLKAFPNRSEAFNY